MILRVESWNPVLNKVSEVKEKWIDKYGHRYDMYDKIEDRTCVERWIEDIDDNYYTELFHPIQFTQYKDLILFRYGKYSNVFSEESEYDFVEFWNIENGFYRECRSVVIDVRTMQLVLTPFSKFMNINESEETSLDNIKKRINNATTVEISDKLDGSMMSARWNNNKLIMSSSQALDPSKSWRLTDAYRMLEENDDYTEMLKYYPDHTFIFEYISIKDAHVVKYDESQEGLYLIGIRSNNSGYDFTYNSVIDIANDFNISSTKVFDKTIEQVMGELGDKKSSEAEGFVLNIDGYKVKVKYDDYTKIHGIISKITSINLIIHNIADDTLDDLISKVPEVYRNRIYKVSKIVFSYISNMDTKVKYYFKLAPKDDKKTFMLWLDQNVPKEYKGYCKEMYFEKPINYIKNGCKEQPHYKTLKEMGVSNYAAVFADEE